MTNELLKNIRELIEELEKLEIDDIENDLYTSHLFAVLLHWVALPY